METGVFVNSEAELYPFASTKPKPTFNFEAAQVEVLWSFKSQTRRSCRNNAMQSETAIVVEAAKSTNQV